MKALLLAAALAGAPPTFDEWRVNSLHSAGWDLVAWGDDTVAYVRDIRGDGNVRRAWVRFENRTPQPWRGSSYRSVARFEEINCSEKTEAVIEGNAYRYNNLRGGLAAWDREGSRYAIPGTISDEVVTKVCGAISDEALLEVLMGEKPKLSTKEAEARWQAFIGETKGEKP